MVIAMYKPQVQLINRLFYAYGINIKANTVDYSEGKEKEFAIIDLTTPLRKGNEVGFLRDKRRINVVLSRPKNSRVVLASRDMVKLPRQSTDAKML
jgi:DNA polymerase alpha-associated DNA helicase A